MYLYRRSGGADYLIGQKSRDWTTGETDLEIAADDTMCIVRAHGELMFAQPHGLSAAEVEAGTHVAMRVEGAARILGPLRVRAGTGTYPDLAFALGRTLGWDEFARADGALGVAPSGQAWAGDAVIVSNAAQAAGAGPHFAVLPVTDSGNLVARGVLLPGSGSAGLLGRFDSGANDSVTFAIDQAGWSLTQFYGGVATSLGSQTVPLGAMAREVVIHSKADRVHVFMDGEHLISASHTVPVSTHLGLNVNGGRVTTFEAYRAIRA